MKKPRSISAADLIESYEDELRQDPKMALKLIIWRTIHDEQPASWARDFLEKVGVFPKAEGSEDRKEMTKKAQIRLIDRKRAALEKSVGLPPRETRGATSDYKRALTEWQRINPRPTKEELLAGWIPRSLPSMQVSAHTKNESSPNPPQNQTESQTETITPVVIMEDEKPDENLRKPLGKNRKKVEPPPKLNAEDYIRKDAAPTEIRVN